MEGIEVKQQTIFSLALIACVIAAGGVAAERGPDWVDGRVRQWQPTAREQRWEEIGWARNLHDALQLGKLRQRPVFLFTHDGRLNVGRC